MKKAVQQFMLGTVMNNEKQTRETLRAMKDAGYDKVLEINQAAYNRYLKKLNG